MNRHFGLHGVALAAVCGAFFLAETSAEAQQPGRSRLLPNPVSSGGNRLNVRDPLRGQGGGQFGDPRSSGQPHAGVDLTAPLGAPVQVVNDGTVIRSVDTQHRPYSTANDAPLPPDFNGAGNRVTVRHSDGTTSAYFHLSGDQQPRVGERVVAGQIIGTVGRTGNVPANADTHLHFETRNRNNTPVKPEIDGISTTSPARIEMNENAPRQPAPTGPAVTPRRSGTTPQTASFRLR